MFERAHPSMIILNLWRVLFLVIIPLIRGFISALSNDLFVWAAGAWIDILVFLFMITFSVLRWFMLTYCANDNTICIRSGILYQKDTAIPVENITSVTVEEAFYLRPFNAAYVRADTMGGSYRRADISLILSRDKARAITRIAGRGGDANLTKQYVPRAASILAMSLITSNSFAGVLFISAFVSQSGKLLGNEFSQLILTTFEALSRALAFGLPPAAAAIAYILLGGWLVGFLNTFISLRNFTVSRKNSTLSISGGAITLRKYALRYDRINFLDIRQNILALVFCLRTLYISVVGYGKVKDDISCIIPAEYEGAFNRNLTMLFPNFSITKDIIRSPKNGLFRFISQPLTACAVIPAALWVLTALFPGWSAFISFTCLMLLIPAVIFLAVQIVAWRTGGLGLNGNYYTVRYSSGLTIHTVIIPKDKIVSVKIRRSPFQLLGKSGTCDIEIRTAAEGRSVHLLRNLPHKTASRFFVS